MIYKTEYKDRPAVAVEGTEITAIFLCEDGGKLASLKNSDGVELLEQAKGEKYLTLTPEGSYIDSECSAFDDMFPTIDPCEMNGKRYLDHGEVCRIAHSYEIKGERLVMNCRANEVNAEFSKEIAATDKGIVIYYRIKNLNDEPLPYIWAGHMMFHAREGAQVFSNEPGGSGICKIFGDMPEEFKAAGKYSEDGESYKYYIAAPFSPLECGIDYKNGEKLTVSFDGEAVKWFGVWINNGSFKGMYNIALEPCTAPYDSPIKAENAGAGSVIEGGGEVRFTMYLRYDYLKK